MWVDLLLPPQCVGCYRELAGALSPARHLCQNCFATLNYWPTSKSFCLRCQNNISYLGYCQACLSFFYFSKLLAAGSYRHPVLRAVLHALKYKNLKDLASPIASFLCDASLKEKLVNKSHEFNIISVPSDKKRFHARGFNPAGLIGLHTAKILGIKYKEGVIKKIKNTIPQMRISNRRQRWKNAQKNYKVVDEKAVYGRRFLLIDDVITTGATLNACAYALKKAGARTVWAGAAAAQELEK